MPHPRVPDYHDGAHELNLHEEVAQLRLDFYDFCERTSDRVHALEQVVGSQTKSAETKSGYKDTVATGFACDIFAFMPRPPEVMSKLQVLPCDVELGLKKLNHFVVQKFTAIDDRYSDVVSKSANDLCWLASNLGADVQKLQMLDLRPELRGNIRTQPSQRSTVDDARLELVQTSIEEACSYKLQETVWGASLLLGMPVGLGTSETIMLFLSLMTQAAMQVSLCVVLVVVARDNYDKVERKSWTCHDAQQVKLYAADDLGPVLSCLTVLMWALCILVEFRHISDFLMAMWYLPKGKQTVLSVSEANNRLFVQQLSFGRLAMSTISAILQATIALCLLIAGSMWLASTISLTDLLLNAVALQFVIEMDELFYHVFCSAKVKTLTTGFNSLNLPKQLVLPFSIPGQAIAALVAWVLFFMLILFLDLIPSFDTVKEAVSQFNCP